MMQPSQIEPFSSTPSIPTTLKTIANTRKEITCEDDAIRVVTNIFERILKKRSLAPNTRFIDLTSDIRKAFILVREFQRATEIELPMSIFFDAPSIADMAEIALTGRIPPQSRLVKMRDGNDDYPPLFLIPGAGGVLIEVLELSRLIEHRGSIYGFTAPGLDGVEEPSIYTEQYARENIICSRDVIKDAPYIFLGHSAGGVAALEMARYARMKGYDVAFLGVLDTNFYERAWPLNVWIRYALRRLHAGTHAKKPAKATSGPDDKAGISPAFILEYLFNSIAKIKNTLSRLGKRLNHRFICDPSTEDFIKGSPYYISHLPSKFQRVRDAAISMSGRYRPRFYDGELVLFRAELGDDLACDPLETWPHVVRTLHVRHTKGDHLTMLNQPIVQDVASEVSTCIAEMLDRFHSRSKSTLPQPMPNNAGSNQQSNP